MYCTVCDFNQFYIRTTYELVLALYLDICQYESQGDSNIEIKIIQLLSRSILIVILLYADTTFINH